MSLLDSSAKWRNLACLLAGVGSNGDSCSNSPLSYSPFVPHELNMARSRKIPSYRQLLWTSFANLSSDIWLMQILSSAPFWSLPKKEHPHCQACYFRMLFRMLFFFLMSSLPTWILPIQIFSSCMRNQPDVVGIIAPLLISSMSRGKLHSEVWLFHL